VSPQSIPGGSLVNRPLPFPIFVTSTITEWSGLAAALDRAAAAISPLTSKATTIEPRTQEG
jgi:hypothetical protein